MKKILVRTSTVPSTLAVFCYEQIQRLSNEFDLHIITSSGDGLEKLLSLPNVTCHVVEMKRRISPIHDAKSLWQMYKLLKKIKPDIVHSVTPKAGLISMLAAKAAGVKRRIHTFTGLVWPTSKGITRLILKSADKILCSAATDIIPESFSVKKTMEDGMITNKELHILGNGSLPGIDLSHFSTSNTKIADLSIKLKEFVYVYIGRLVSDKGVNELVSAFVELDKKYNDISLLLVGPREENIDALDKDTVRHISECKDIIEVGSVSDVRPYLKAANILVLPSYREGLPNAVIEAGAMCLPCIVSDIPGCTEIIEDGKNGFVVPVKDISALKNVMEISRENPSLCMTLGVAARHNIEIKYDKELVFKELLNYYTL